MMISNSKPSCENAMNSSERLRPLNWSMATSTAPEPIYGVEAPLDRSFSTAGMPPPPNSITTLLSLKKKISDERLPLLVDKIRNNVRSRPLLAGVYGAAAAVVAMLIILSFSFDRSISYAMSFRYPPPPSIPIGSPMPPFSVQILDGSSEGVPRVDIGSILIPVNDIDLVVKFPTGSFVSRTVQCVPSLVLTNSSTMLDDLLFCAPEFFGLKTGGSATTDDRGVATFSNTTLGFGNPGEYLLVIVAKGLDLTITTFLRLTAQVVDVDVADMEPFTPALAVSPPERHDSCFTVNMTATWTVAVGSPPPVFVCAALISLQLASNTPRPPVLMPATDPLVPGSALLYNATSCTYDIITSSMGNNGSADLLTFSANISISPILRGSNTDQLYIGLYFMGMIIPLSSVKLNSRFQFPPVSLMPFLVSTDVASVRVLSNIPDEITEATPFPHGGLVVSVHNTAGESLPLRGVFLHSQPSHLNPAATGMSAVYSPNIYAKSLIFGVSISSSTNLTSNGSTATFTDLMFSGRGAIGYYDIFVISDGVYATFPHQLSNGSVEFLPYKTVFVNTQADPLMSSVFLTGETQLPVYIGEPWARLPLVVVRDSNGQLLVGKALFIRARNDSQCAVVSQNVLSSDDGAATITSAVVPYCAGGPQDAVVFDALIDGLVVGNFTLSLLMRSPTSAPSTDRQCSFVRVVSTSQLAFSDVPFAIVFQAVGVDGSPVSRAAVVLQLSPPFITPITTSVNGTGPSFLTTDDQGYLNYSLLASYTSGSFGGLVTVACFVSSTREGGGAPASLLAVNNMVSASFRPRVRKLVVTPLHNGNKTNDVISYRVSIVPHDWSTISAANPVTIFLVARWAPNYVSNWYSIGKAFVLSSSVTISSEAENNSDPSSNSTIVTWSTHENTPGLFGAAFSVSGNYFGPVVFRNRSSTIKALELVQSPFAQESGSVLLPGKVFPVAPVVRVISDDNEPVVGITLFAQNLLLHQNGSVSFLDIYNDLTAVYFGVFLRVDSSSGQVNGGAFSDPSNSSGYASFSNLLLVSMPVDLNVTFRYCFAQDVVFDMNFPTSVVSYCVMDNFSASVPPSKQLDVSIWVAGRNGDVLSGTPGQYLPDIVMSGLFRDGTRPEQLICTPVLSNASSSYINMVQEPGVPVGVFIGGGYTLELSTVLQLSEVMPSGTYSLYFLCAGAQTPALTLLVSNQVASISTLITATSISIAQITLLNAMLLGDSGKAVANSPLQAILSPADPLCGANLKSPAQCGSFYQGSRTYDVSDSTGNAELFFAFLTAETGVYNLEVTVPSVESTLGIQNIAKTQFQLISAMLEMSSSSTTALIQRVAPIFSTVVGIVQQLANSEKSGGVSLYRRATVEILDILGLETDGQALVRIPIAVTNPVNSIEAVFNQGSILLQLSPLSELGLSHGATILNMTQGCPVVRFLDSSGQPVPSAALTVEVWPPSSDPFFAILSTNTNVSDSDGVVSLCPLSIAASRAGETSLLVTSSGGGGGVYFNVIVQQDITVTRTEAMKFLAVGLVIFFSPLLLSGVPHSSLGYEVFGVLMTGSLLVMGILFTDKIPDSPYYRGYYLFVLISLAAVGAASAFMMVIDCIGYRSKSPLAYWLRFVNDEKKATSIFLYVEWLTNISVEKQQAEEECSGDDGDLELLAQVDEDDLADALSYNRLHHNESPSSSKLRGIARHLQRVRYAAKSVSAQLTSTSSINSVRMSSRSTTKKTRSLVYNRQDISPDFVPFGFYIVVIFTLVLLVSLAFLLVFIFHEIDVFFSQAPCLLAISRKQLDSRQRQREDYSSGVGCDSAHCRAVSGAQQLVQCCATAAACRHHQGPVDPP